MSEHAGRGLSRVRADFHRKLGLQRPGTLLRAIADLLLANVAHFLAFAAWCFAYFVRDPGISWAAVYGRFVSHYVEWLPLFSGTIFLTFVFSGLYGRVSGYTIRGRITAILRATSLGILLYLVAVSFLMRERAPMRGAMLLSWFAITAGMMATRLGKTWFDRHFKVRRVSSPKERRVEDVLIIGGAGYIGSVMVREMLARGYRVTVLDRLIFGDSSIREVRQNPLFSLLEGDFRNVDTVVKAISKADAVVHLGAIVGDPACALDDTMTKEVNLAATQMIREVCCGFDVHRFVFASTCSVYGIGDSILDEQSELNPASLYAGTKIDAERAVLQLASDTFRPTVLRLATAFGLSHRPRFDLVANLLTAQAVTQKKITIFNGQQWRPFVHIRDIAKAVILCLEAPLDVVGNEVFNVGDSQMNYTLGELGETVARLVPGTEVVHVVRGDDPRDYRVSFDKIRAALDFRCDVLLEEGLREIVAALQSGDIGDYRDPTYSNVALLSASPEKLTRYEEDVHVRMATSTG